MPNWMERLEDGLFLESLSMGPPWGPVLRRLRYPAALVRDWLNGELNIRAMSLAYTTLLSLVPLMVFSFAILKGLGARGDLKFLLREFFRPLGGAATQLTESVLQFVQNMRGELLGAIGLAFLIYTVVTTVQKVEGSFNFVWRVARQRSFARRFTEYLSVMILGPILLAVALGLLGSAEQSPLAHWLQAVAPLAWVFNVVGRLLPYAIVTVVFTCMYWFIPNTRVQLRAALIGGVTAGVIWALVGKAFTAVIFYSSQMVAVYTGFAIVLTTLIWVYLSWLILLIGAQLAFYVQFPQCLRHGQDPTELAAGDREQIGLAVMYLIGCDYGTGRRHWTSDRLASEFDLPGSALAPVLARLEGAGLILATEKEQFVPGRDPQGILLADILVAVRTLPVGRRMIEVRRVAGAARVMAEVEAAVRERLGAQTLKDLIAAGNTPAAS
jgi:membrane protein